MANKLKTTRPCSFQKDLYLIALILAFCFNLSLDLKASQAPAAAQENKPNLSLEKIMAGPDFIGSPPSSPAWAIDSQTLYFQWKKPGEKNTELYSVSLTNPVPVKITKEKILQNPPAGSFIRSRFGLAFGFGRFGSQWQWDKNRKRLLVNQNGEIFLYDLASKKAEQLTSTDQPETNLGFTFDQKKIYYLAGDNLYLLSLTDRSLRQLTSFTREKQPEPRKTSEIEKWYEDQQRALFKEIFRMGFEGAESFRRQVDLLPALSQVTSRRKPFYLNENQRIVMAEPSPDEKFVIFLLSEQLPAAKNTIVPNYVSRSGYTETISSHTKAAENSQLLKLGLMNSEKGEVIWVDYGQGERQINPRQWLWSPDGKKCLIAAESEDRKDAWLFLLDWTTGKTTILENVHDEAWIGPLSLTNVFWWPDSQHLSYISEKNGYAHLYKLSIEGKENRALTEGHYEITSAYLSADGQKVYLVSSELHPGERHL
ncbi:MAG: DPP IV N-terminal domain-containing protein, partial [Candidatus Saccharicenans sp.]